MVMSIGHVTVELYQGNGCKTSLQFRYLKVIYVGCVTS